MNRTRWITAAAGWAGKHGLMALLAAALIWGGACTVRDQNVAFSQRELGEQAFARGDYVEARMRFNNALSARPDDFRQNYWLGRVELAEGRPLAAQRQFEFAWDVRPDDPTWTPRILDGIAESLFQQNRVEALHTFLAETSSRYGTTDAHLREAHYLVRTGDPDAAKVSFQKAARVSGGTDAKVFLAIAEFYESFNDVPNAVKALRYAYYLDPENQKVAEMFRRFGIVPGPTLRLEPPRPDLLD